MYFSSEAHRHRSHNTNVHFAAYTMVSVRAPGTFQSDQHCGTCTCKNAPYAYREAREKKAELAAMFILLCLKPLKI